MHIECCTRGRNVPCRCRAEGNGLGNSSSVDKARLGSTATVSLTSSGSTAAVSAASFGNTNQRVDSYHCKRHKASHMCSDDGSWVPTTGHGFSLQAIATQAIATQAIVIRHIVSVTGKVIRQVTSQEKPQIRRRHPWPQQPMVIATQGHSNPRP